MKIIRPVTAAVTRYYRYYITVDEDANVSEVVAAAKKEAIDLFEQGCLDDLVDPELDIEPEDITHIDLSDDWWDYYEE